MKVHLCWQWVATAAFSTSKVCSAQGAQGAQLRNSFFSV